MRGLLPAMMRHKRLALIAVMLFSLTNSGRFATVNSWPAASVCNGRWASSILMGAPGDWQESTSVYDQETGQEIELIQLDHGIPPTLPLKNRGLGAASLI